MKKKFALIASIAILSLTGCKGNDNPTPTPPEPVIPDNPDDPKDEKVALATPVVEASKTKSGEVVWGDVANAAYYLVFVNGSSTGVEVVGTSYKVPLLDNGVTSTVKVQAKVESGDEKYKDSELSNEVTVSHFASESNSWDKETFVSEWSPSSGVLETLNEGLDLKKGQSMAIVKNITKEKPYLTVTMRDFEGQEDGETGAKVKLTIDGVTVNAINFETSEITLDKNCGREMLVIYRLDNLGLDLTKAHVIRIAEVSNYSNHCVIINAEIKDITDVISVATQKNYWGRNYIDNWGGEMNPRDGVSAPETLANDSSWIKVGTCEDINEGLKLQKEGSITKLVHVTKETSYMTIAVRNFGGADEDYAGGVTVNGVGLVAIGDKLPLFTKKTSPTYFEGAGDGCEVATMKTYDLSSYIGQDVWVSILNLKCYVLGGNEDLVIGSVSFGSEKKITESETLETSNIDGYSDTKSLMIAGPATMYGEGISFRSQDFAGGISETLDLSDIEAGKHVYVKTYWRALCEDNILATFQAMVDGSLEETYKDYLTRDRSDNFAVVGIDLTDKVGSKTNYSIHIPSRNYRMVLSKIEYVVTDEVDENLSYPAKEDTPIVEYSNGEFAWGHDFKENWGGEMGDDSLKYAKILESWSSDGDANDGFGEGLKLGRGSSISKTLTIDEKHTTMAFGARTFGADFKGEVRVKDGDNEVALKAIGYNDDYFTKNGAYTKLDEVSDDCQNAVMYAYDLSKYLNKEVTITIKNLAGPGVDGDKDENGYDDRLVISSIGFTSIFKVTESKSWDASVIKQLNDNTALEVLPVGPFSIYNEGINFRTQDLAGGITRTFDLSDEALSGKSVKVRVGFRNFNGDGEDIDFQLLLNGALVQTKQERIDESVKYLEFDLTQLVGQSNVNLGIHIPTRTFRICLTNLDVVVD